MKTATQLEMQAIDPAQAFGPEGILVIIAGRNCHVRNDGLWWHVTYSGGEPTNAFPRDRFTFVQVRDAMAKFFGGEAGTLPGEDPNREDWEEEVVNPDDDWNIRE